MRDIDVRRALHVHELARYKDDPETRVVPELGIIQGANRVDIAVVNGSLHGYEIKSERDTLARLPGQVDAYCKVFDTVTIVVASSHLEKARSMIPAWWGILEASSGRGEIVRLRRRRKEKSNPGVNSVALAQLLWKDEALALLEREGNAQRMRNKPRRAVWEALAEQLDVDTLRACVRETLKAREGWRSEM